METITSPAARVPFAYRSIAQSRTVITTPVFDDITPRSWRKSELREYLQANGIDMSEWGTGPYEGFDKLHDTLNKEHVELRKDEASGKVVLHVKVAVLFVECVKDRRRWLLYEAKKDFGNGHAIVRDQFDGSLGETFKRHEAVMDAFHRGLREELRFKNRRLYILSMMGSGFMGPIPHDKFKGLYGCFYRMKSHCLIQPSLHEPVYTHTTKGKTHTFLWHLESDDDLRPDLTN